MRQVGGREEKKRMAVMGLERTQEAGLSKLKENEAGLEDE